MSDIGNYACALEQRFHNRSAVIGVVGLGYVGLPLALSFVERGFKVLGFDIDNGKVRDLKVGRSYIKHISDKRVTAADKFDATTDFSAAHTVDALIICVPTPLSRNREPDLRFITSTMDSLIPYLRPGQLLSLESTTYPGTTDQVLLPRIEERGLKVGENFFLAFSPEREDPGNPNYSTSTIPKVCGGTTPSCLKVAVAMYSGVVDRVVPVSSTRAAEMTKLLENIQRSVNIGLVNEMKMIADRMGIDIFEVVDAAATKPFGFSKYYPGPGVGGHCIPIDPFYLTWKAREYGLNTHFIELAGEINHDMPKWVFDKIADALNDRGKSVKGSKILILGIAYKRDIGDARESPSVAVMELLRAKDAIVSYADPNVPVFPQMREHHFDLVATEITPESLATFDCVALLTDHSDFPYDLLLKHAKLLVDTRGRYRQAADNLVKA